MEMAPFSERWFWFNPSRST